MKNLQREREGEEMRESGREGVLSDSLRANKSTEREGSC